MKQTLAWIGAVLFTAACGNGADGGAAWSGTVEDSAGVQMVRNSLEPIWGEGETWGFEDVDLQWKLAQVGPLDSIPAEIQLQVIHLDHDKPYYSIADNRRNKRLCLERQAAGIDVVIAQDRRVARSAFLTGSGTICSNA